VGKTAGVTGQGTQVDLHALWVHTRRASEGFQSGGADNSGCHQWCGMWERGGGTRIIEDEEEDRTCKIAHDSVLVFECQTFPHTRTSDLAGLGGHHKWVPKHHMQHGSNFYLLSLMLCLTLATFEGLCIGMWSSTSVLTLFDTSINFTTF